MPKENYPSLQKSDVYGITLLLGLLGVLFAGTGNVATTNNTGPDDQAKEQRAGRGPVVGDQFPSSDDTLSYTTSLWGDPWEKEAKSAKEGEMRGEGATLVGDLLVDTCIKDQDNRLLVLPVIVDGNSDEEGVKSRVRRRHAVELALSTFGYRMRFPNRMTYKSCVIDYHLTRRKSIDAEFEVPIKLYHHVRNDEKAGTSDDTFILVIWIKEEFLGACPMHALGQLVHQVCDVGKHSKLGKSRLVICGPTYSETLALMQKDTTRAAESLFKNWHAPRIFNASCTSSTLDKPTEIRFSNTKIPIHHFIDNDRQLSESISKELDHRGIGSAQESQIALFVEQGPHEFVQQLASTFKNQEGNVLQIPYLKGIGSKQEEVADYLSRTLAEVRKRLPDQTLQVDKVQAVGIFGSQTSDKLAIARAAKDKFPVATFFTTDLDADLVAEPACQNMIIASHFGFGVEGSLFNVELSSLPSFRDQYQVSTFLAIGTAASYMQLGEPQVETNGGKQSIVDLWGRTDDSSRTLNSVLFEIGRKGAVQLNGPSFRNSKVVHHRPSRRRVRLRTIALVILIVGGPTWLLLCVLATESGYIRGRLELIAQRSKRIRKVVRTVVTGLVSLFNTNAILRTSNKDENETRTERTQTAKQATKRTTKEKISPDSVTRTSLSDWLTFVWLVIITFCGLILWVIAINGDRHDGEPLSFFDAISIWPPVFILFAVGCAGLWRIAEEIRDVLENGKDRKSRDRTLSNGAAMALIFLIGVFGYVMLVGELGIPPARSTSARIAANATLLFSCGSLICLAAISASRILRARGVIASQKETFQQDFSREMKETRTTVELSVIQQGYFELCSAMDTGTRASRKLLAPALLTIFFASARFPLLDSWQMHPSSYVIIFVPLVVSVCAAWAMRRKSQDFKREALREIDRYVGRKLAAGIGKEALETASEYRKLIQQLDQGPFGPISADPLLGGVLLIVTASITGPFREITTGIIHTVLRL